MRCPGCGAPDDQGCWKGCLEKFDPLPTIESDLDQSAEALTRPQLIRRVRELEDEVDRLKAKLAERSLRDWHA